MSKKVLTSTSLKLHPSAEIPPRQPKTFDNSGDRTFQRTGSSNRPLVVTSGVALLEPGKLATEDIIRAPNHPFPRDPEATAFAFAPRGVRVTAVRLPPVTYANGSGGFANILLQTAREKKVSAYVGEGIPFKEIATAIGCGLNVPIVSKSAQEAVEHFGWFAKFAMVSVPSSAEKTKALLGWKPKQAGLIEDIGASKYNF